MNLKKSILKVFSVNFLKLITSLIIAFIVPNILSIEGYANLKTYGLYISYIGILHFGFIDGLYIKYGGKKFEDIDKKVLKGEHCFLLFFETIITITLLTISYFTKNIIILLFGLTLLPTMLQQFYTTIYQATGSYNKYSKIHYIYSLIYLSLNIILAVILKSTNYIFYCLTSFFAYTISISYFEIKSIKDLKKEEIVIDKLDILRTIKTGFFILLGNLSIVGLFGIDKWFIKWFFTTKDFAYYSFAVSMFNLINIVISAISITFYNYLFNNNNEKKINELKNNLIILGGFASLAYFAFSFIVNNFIKKYIPSLDIVAITFATYPYLILINALYVNLYKVNKNEKKYFKVVIGMLIVSIIYNMIAVIFFKSIYSIAIATVLTMATWVIYSSIDLKKIEATSKMYTYMILLSTAFLITSHCFEWWLGGLCYLIIYIILTFLYDKNVFKRCILLLKNNDKNEESEN